MVEELRGRETNKFKLKLPARQRRNPKKPVPGLKPILEYLTLEPHSEKSPNNRMLDDDGGKICDEQESPSVK